MSYFRDLTADITLNQIEELSDALGQKHTADQRYWAALYENENEPEHFGSEMDVAVRL